MRKYKQIAKRTSKNLKDIKGHFIGFKFNKVAFRGRTKSANMMYLIDKVRFVNQENRHIYHLLSYSILGFYQQYLLI